MRMVVAREGAEVDGQAEVVEGELAIFAGNGEVADGGEALVEGFGEGVADPVEGGLAGAVGEGQNEDDFAGAGCLVGLAVERRGEGDEQEQKRTGSAADQVKEGCRTHPLSIEAQ